jgi:hypothetical protein
MKDLGGAAFPVLKHYANGHIEQVAKGMSLRDYFAAAAVQGLLASNWCAQMRELAPELGVKQTANDAYDIADAMLKARGQ